VTCLPTLLTASVVIAASLLGGCSDSFMTAGGANTTAPQPQTATAATAPAAALPTRAADLAALPQIASVPAMAASTVGLAAPAITERTSRPAVALAPARRRLRTAAADQQPQQQLASAALGDQDLSQIRGGFEASSGVTLNFAFQQATYINNNLAQTVVVPTLTVSPSQGGISVAGASPTTGASPPSVNVSSLTDLGVSAQTQNSVGSAKLLANGTVQAEVGAASPVVQALVNSGMTSIVSSLGNGGLTSVISNAANNRVVQQMTTIDLGVSGLSTLMQQSIPQSVLNRISGPSTFR
jgi:hypothetical protein